MKVHHQLDSFSPDRPVVLTIGTFDGVHKGHQSILKRTRDIAQRIGGCSVLLTFFPHPRKVLGKDDNLNMLQTPTEQADKLASLKLDHLVRYPFSLEFSQWSADRYIEQLLVEEMRVHTLVVGYDHRFGSGRSGSYSDLLSASRSFGFRLEEISALELKDVAVSSTKIRKALSEGQVDKAKHYLSNWYSMEAIVIKGKQIGRTIGFPTANLKPVHSEKIVPGSGVYLVRVLVSKNETAYGMCNIGINPTISERNTTQIEVHLFDWSRDIYGKTLRVEWLKNIRKERSFESLKALKEQLQRDKTTCLALIPSFVI